MSAGRAGGLIRDGRGIHGADTEEQSPSEKNSRAGPNNSRLGFHVATVPPK